MEPGVEAQIREWRSYLQRRRTIAPTDVDELEDHLRSEISNLGAAGLSADESFLVAIKRLGGVSELSREFARERSSRLWKQLVLAGEGVRERSGFQYLEMAVMVGFAIAAAVAFKLPAAFGINPFAENASDSAGLDTDAAFYLRNASLLTLTYLGAVRAVTNYNVMGLAKASLEANVRYLAAALGPEGTRVNAISAGPIKTLAAAGIGGFSKILSFVEHAAPLRRNVTIDEVGNVAAFYFSPLSSAITGEITYVDGGFSNVAAGLDE